MPAALTLKWRWARNHKRVLLHYAYGRWLSAIVKKVPLRIIIRYHHALKAPP
ncbi:hypothetical protein CZ787_03480 [Halomonas citrativorans]|uniref:Uncharacterized protein n=1 Tax=Halomonas citrativorans TaxID=2742612 RepID=A0A1R4HS15_9GAMM|nr:hypothetical protein CZ787_03480 [Halomonas citrativorans]